MVMNFAAPENACAPTIGLTCDNKSILKVKQLSVYSVTHCATESYGQTDTQLQTSSTFSTRMSKGLHRKGVSLSPSNGILLI